MKKLEKIIYFFFKYFRNTTTEKIISTKNNLENEENNYLIQEIQHQDCEKNEEWILIVQNLSEGNYEDEVNTEIKEIQDDEFYIRMNSSEIPCAGDVSMPCDGDVSMPCDGDVSMPCDGDVSMPCDGDVSMPCDGDVNTEKLDDKIEIRMNSLMKNLKKYKKIEKSSKDRVEFLKFIEEFDNTLIKLLNPLECKAKVTKTSEKLKTLKRNIAMKPQPPSKKRKIIEELKCPKLIVEEAGNTYVILEEGKSNSFVLEDHDYSKL